MLTDCDQNASMRTAVEATFDRTALVQRLTAAADRYGNPTLGNPATVATVPCSLARTGQREVTADRDTQIADWTCRLPAGTDITGRDHLLVDGVRYEVVGPPVTFPTHVHADVRHVDG